MITDVLIDDEAGQVRRKSKGRGGSLAAMLTV
jgi:hypothetical protein